MRVGQLEGVIIASDLMRYSYFLTGSGLEQAACHRVCTMF